MALPRKEEAGIKEEEKEEAWEVGAAWAAAEGWEVAAWEEECEAVVVDAVVAVHGLQVMVPVKQKQFGIILS
jgi:hypothetical protein